jgi:hypothetical protein
MYVCIYVFNIFNLLWNVFIIFEVYFSFCVFVCLHADVFILTIGRNLSVCVLSLCLYGRVSHQVLQNKHIFTGVCIAFFTRYKFKRTKNCANTHPNIDSLGAHTQVQRERHASQNQVPQYHSSPGGPVQQHAQTRPAQGYPPGRPVPAQHLPSQHAQVGAPQSQGYPASASQGHGVVQQGYAAGPSHGYAGQPVPHQDGRQGDGDKKSKNNCSIM